MTLHAGPLRGKRFHKGEMADSGFETLFNEHWERVYAVIFRIVGDGAEAEDLAVEVFLRLYHRPPSDADGPRITGWLYRVATNLGLNALRARNRRQRYERWAIEASDNIRKSPDPDLELERSQERNRVRRILQEMKTREARILILRHSGLSYAEIAAAMEVSPNSVGTMLARAEREFERRYLELEGGG